MLSVQEVLSVRGEDVQSTRDDPVWSICEGTETGLKCGEASLLRRGLDKTDDAMSTGSDAWGEDVLSDWRDLVFSKISDVVVCISKGGLTLLRLDLGLIIGGVAVFGVGDVVCKCGVARLLRLVLGLINDSLLTGTVMFARGVSSGSKVFFSKATLSVSGGDIIWSSADLVKSWESCSVLSAILSAILLSTVILIMTGTFNPLSLEAERATESTCGDSNLDFVELGDFAFRVRGDIAQSDSDGCLLASGDALTAERVLALHNASGDVLLVEGETVERREDLGLACLSLDQLPLSCVMTKC